MIEVWMLVWFWLSHDLTKRAAWHGSRRIEGTLPCAYVLSPKGRRLCYLYRGLR
jgi:hypothetical protein